MTKATRSTRPAVTAPPPPSPAGGKAFLLFVLGSLLLYGITLGNGFVHDDKPLVANNQLIRDPLAVGRILTSGYWTTRADAVPELYRPLTILSLALNHAVGGTNPIGYHLVNLLLHAAVSFLVLRLALAVGARPAVGWIASLLFLVHPVHTEAVAPVVGRSELLAAALVLASLLAHRRAAREYPGRGGGFILAAGTGFFAASLAKENALIFPALALGLDALFPIPARTGPRRIFRWPSYAAYLLAMVASLGMRAAALGGILKSDIRPEDNILITLDRLTAFRTAVAAAGKYLALLAWPFRLSADYSGGEISPVGSFADPRFLIPAAAIAGGLALAIAARRGAPLASFGVYFHALAILPVSNLLFPIGTLFAERLLYLPSVGACLLAGVALGWLRTRWPAAAIGLLIPILLAGSARTVDRNRVWRDDLTFASATAADAPRSARAQFNLGVALEERGDFPGAQAAYQRAVELSPAWGDALYNLAGLRVRSGRSAEGIELYRRALETRPGDPRYRMNLGYALYRAGRHEEAIALYREMLSRDGESAPVLNSLGANLLASGDAPAAIEAYRRAVALDPRNLPYRLNLAQAIAASGDLESAASEYRSVLQASPDDPNALRGLGVILAGKGEKEEARRLLLRAESLVPGGLDPEARAALDALR